MRRRIVATVVDDAPPDAAAREAHPTDLGSNLFVEAGAGAGKTTALVGRVLGARRRRRADHVDRRDHVHREGRRRAPPPAARRPDRRRGTESPDRHRSTVAPSTTSTTPRSARCTRSPAGCSSSSRSRPGCRPGSRCSTSSRATSPSTSAGRTCSTGCSTTPTRPLGAIDGGASSCSCASSTASGSSAAFGASPRTSRPTGTSSTDRVDLDAAATIRARHRADSALRCRRCSARTPHPTATRRTKRLRELAELSPRARRPSSRSAPASMRSLASHARCRQGRARSGNKTNWKRHGGADALDALRDARTRDARRPATELIRRRRGRTASGSLGAIVGRSCSTAPTPRAADGTLEFHDLLVLARRLLATRPDVRAALHRALPAGAARRVPGHRPDPARDRGAPHGAPR